MSDPIRARLDEMAEYSLGCPSICCYSEDYVAALRAVLDLCDSRHSDTGYGVVRLDTLRRVIAEHLGVTE